MGDSMRPSPDWGATAREFRALTGQQLLCVTCLQAGVEDPPSQALVIDGRSYCLEHGKQRIHQ